MSQECTAESSFAVATSQTINGSSVEGCYAANGRGNVTAVTWYRHTRDGVFSESPVVWYGSAAFHDDHAVWALGLFHPVHANTIGAVSCRDGDLQDAFSLHPSQVLNWMCFLDGDYTVPMSAVFTCDCFTPAPIGAASATPSPTSPTDLSEECTLRSSFAVTTSQTINGATIDGCYAFSGTTPAGVAAYTLEGVLWEAQVAWYGALGFHDDHSVWGLGTTDANNTVNGTNCIDGDLQDASTLHPSQVLNWLCDSDGDYTAPMSAVFTCDCFTPAPIGAASATPSPASPTDLSEECTLRSSFAVTTSQTINGATIDGCYAFSGTTPAGVAGYTLEGVLWEAQVAWYGALGFHDDHSVWGLGTTDASNTVNGTNCIDGDLQDASTLHPSQVLNWLCDSDGDYTAPMSAVFTCDCFTPSPIAMSGKDASPSPLTSGEVIGIAVGCVVAAALLLAGFLWRRRNAVSKDGGDDYGPAHEQQLDELYPPPTRVTAALEMAEELAHHCLIPGISEAAGILSILVRLVSNSREFASRGDAIVKRCLSIVMILKKAAKTLGEGETAYGKDVAVFVEDVYDAAYGLVELIKTYQSKDRLTKGLMSTHFKQRQDELDAVLDRALLRLNVSLQVQAGEDIKEVLRLQQAPTDDRADSLAEARLARRRRKLAQLEIPKDDVIITDELLGRGGFGEVYLADYNGYNAAAKVLRMTHGFRKPDDNDASEDGPSRYATGRSQNNTFLREVEAMMRLRSPYVVHVYGVITSPLDHPPVLVMELLPGGDLRGMLDRISESPLEEEHVRQLIGDICAGMAFLHGKETVHGDLKSANILLDGDGRAKISDFGTSRWSRNTDESTGLATDSTEAGPTPGISVAWTAPEVLDSHGITYKSDVYSFGIVVWEVLSRKLPWANKTRPSQILCAVLKGDRPSFPKDAPADIVEIAEACWCTDPKKRTTFSAILERGME